MNVAPWLFVAGFVGAIAFGGVIGYAYAHAKITNRMRAMLNNEAFRQKLLEDLAAQHGATLMMSDAGEP